MKKRKDGRYQRRFTVSGIHCVVMGRNKAELDAKEYKKRQEIESGRATRENPTLDEYFNKWIDAKRGTAKDATLFNYTRTYGVMSRMELPNTGKKLGAMRLKEVLPDDIRALQSEMAKTLNTNTINERLSLLSCIFYGAIEERRIDFNPCKPVKALKRKEKTARETVHRALTKQEVDAFMSKAKDSYYYDVYRLALATGLRVGEIGALTNRDIHDGFIWVNKTITKAETGGKIIGDTPKSKSGIRKIPLNDDIRRILEHQKSMNALLYGNVVSMDSLIFRSFTGGFINDVGIIRNMRKLCKEAGVEYFTMHAFRATFATRCIECGINPKTVQSLLGHSNFNITMSLYGHTHDDTKIEAMETLQRYANMG